MLYHLFSYLDKHYDMVGTGLFQYITFRAALGVLISLLISLLFGNKVINWLQGFAIEAERNLGLPNADNKRKVPSMGGVLIHTSILVPTLLLGDLTNVYVWLMILATVMMGAVGFLDDYLKLKSKAIKQRRAIAYEKAKAEALAQNLPIPEKPNTEKEDSDGLAGWYKVLGQVLLGTVVGLVLFFNNKVVVRVDRDFAFSGKCQIIETVKVEKIPQSKVYEEMYHVKTSITNVPFFKGNEFDYSSLLFFLGENARDWVWIIFIPLIILIVTAVSNSANLTDGVDGLAAGVSAIIGAVLCVLAYISGNHIFADYLNVLYIPYSGELVIFAACFWGACVGFLWFNAHPAQVFMGDTGSLALGSCIAVMAIIIRKELLLPLLCGIFFVEALSVIIQRLVFKYRLKKYGRPYAEANRVFLMTPLHHHYQKKGIHDSKLVTRFWLIGIFLAVLTVVTLKIR